MYVCLVMVMFGNGNICLVLSWWSHEFCKLASLHPTHVHDSHLRSISCCRYSAYIRVRFWRQVRIEASYRVAFAIAKEKKPHTTWEWLSKPFTMDWIENKKKKLKKIWFTVDLYMQLSWNIEFLMCENERRLSKWLMIGKMWIISFNKIIGGITLVRYAQISMLSEGRFYNWWITVTLFTLHCYRVRVGLGIP